MTKTKGSIRILSFDPAAGKMGWAFSEYNLQSKKLIVRKIGLIKGDQIIKTHRKTMLDEYGKQFTVLHAIREVAETIIRENEPDYVVTEGPFAHRFVQAYASLKLVIDRLRQAAQSTLNQTVYEVQPKEAKLATVGKGTADKDEIRAAILAHKNIKFMLTRKISPKRDISEHEFDAISVAYCFTQRVLPGILDKKET